MKFKIWFDGEYYWTYPANPIIRFFYEFYWVFSDSEYTMIELFDTKQEAIEYIRKYNAKDFKKFRARWV